MPPISDTRPPVDGRRLGPRPGPLPAGAAALLAATVALELASTIGVWDRVGVLGWVWIRPSAIPAALLLGALGGRLLAGARRWAPAAAISVAVIAVEALRHLDAFGGAAGFGGLAVAAVHEEVVFRGAIPVALWAVAARAGLGAPAARSVTLAGAAVFFAVQPNHVAQGTWPFLIFALLFCLCVRSPAALLPAALAHLAFNVLSLATLAGEIDPLTRGAGTLAVLGSFVITAFFHAAAEERAGGPAGAAWTPPLTLAGPEGPAPALPAAAALPVD